MASLALGGGLGLGGGLLRGRGGGLCIMRVSITVAALENEIGRQY